MEQGAHQLLIVGGHSYRLRLHGKLKGHPRFKGGVGTKASIDMEFIVRHPTLARSWKGKTANRRLGSIARVRGLAQKGYFHAKRGAVPVDAARWIWDGSDHWLQQTTQILGKFHAL